MKVLLYLSVMNVKNFPVVSNTVGQLQDSAAIRNFEVIEI